MISLELKELLIEAASRYETADFIPKDPVQFPHRYKMKRDIEIAGLVTALMSFGNRKQIIGKADKLCLMMGKSPLEYVKERVFEKDFSYDDNSSFYRMISHANFRDIFEKLYEVYDNAESMEEYVLSFNSSRHSCCSHGKSVWNSRKGSLYSFFCQTYYKCSVRSLPWRSCKRRFCTFWRGSREYRAC